MLNTRQPVLRRFWYAVMPVSDLAEGPKPFTLLGEPIVLFLNRDGAPVALEDRCCHRTAKLSKGWVKDGHIAIEVDDIYAYCQKVMDAGVVMNRPPRDGRMAFVRSPDLISVEILQKGDAKPVSEPWTSMPNIGVW